jgi:hypothetical protein
MKSQWIVMSINALGTMLYLTQPMSWAADTAPRADEYKRVVHLDWDEIPDAETYQVEWLAGPVCRKSLGNGNTEKPAWDNRLPPGNYCVRVRGVGIDEQEGEWSDFYRIELKPRPPQNLSVAGNKAVWEKNPYAKSYLVDLKDATGKVVMTREVTQPEVQLPDNLLKDPRYAGKNLSLSVRAKTENAPLSQIVTQEFTNPFGGASGGPIADIAQKNAAKKPLTFENAVETYRLTGERVAPPSAQEWAAAKSPEQQEKLRQRQLLSQKIQLYDVEERKHSPYIRVKAGFIFGPYVYTSKVPSNASNPSLSQVETQTQNGWSIGYGLAVRYDPGGPWGGFLRFNYRSASHGHSRNFSNFALGGERHFLLDKASDSFLSIGLGVEYSEQSLGVDETDSSSGSSYFSFPFAVLGGTVNVRHRFRMNPRWQWETAAFFRYAPPQDNIPSRVPGVTATGMNGIGYGASFGPAYQYNKLLDLQFGLSISSYEVKNSSGFLGATLVDSGAYVQAVYKMDPSDERNAWAEAAKSRDLKSTWSLRLEPGLTSRYLTSFNVTGSGSTPENENVITRRVRGELRHKIFQPGRWSILADMEVADFTTQGHHALEGGAGLKAGFETLLRGRNDISGLVTLGLGLRSVQATYGTQVHELSATQVELAGRLIKAWNDRWMGELEAMMGVPFSVRTGQQSLRDGSGVGQVGFNYMWRVGAVVGYRSGPVTFRAGYDFQHLRYGIAGRTQIGVSMLDFISYSEDQFKLGVSWDF